MLAHGIGKALKRLLKMITIQEVYSLDSVRPHCRQILLCLSLDRYTLYEISLNEVSVCFENMFSVRGTYLLPLHHTSYSIYELYRYRVLLHLVFKKLFDQTRKLYVIENIEKG